MTSLILNEIKKILKEDIRINGIKSYQPNINNLIVNGKPTKKALAYNRKLIREGKTFLYLDEKVRFNPLSNKGKGSFYKISDDKRFKTKVLKKKFKEQTTVGQVNVGEIFTSKTNNTYKLNLYSKIRTIKDDLKANIGKEKYATKKVIVDLQKINFKDSLDVIKSLILSNTNDKIISMVAKPTNSNTWIMLSSNNIIKLNKYEDLQGSDFTTRYGSDNEFIYNTLKSKKYEIKFTLKEKKAIPSGAFFKYHHKINDLDLTRYGIFNENDKFDKNYNKDNCLYIALKNGGMDIKDLNNMKTFVKNSSVPTCKLNEICDILDITINVSKLTTRKDQETRTKTIQYGKSKENIYNLGLLDEHYFIIDKETKITSYAIENYEEIKDIEDYNKIFKVDIVKGKKYYKKRNDRFIDSYKIIKLLLEKKHLLTPISIDELMKTPYYNDLIDNNNLEYDDCCIDTNKQINTNRKEHLKIFFDFETNTQIKDKDGNNLPHRPYLMCSVDDHDDKQSFFGDKCGENFINYIKNKYKDNDIIDLKGRLKGNQKNIILIAHNCRYDFTFILNYLYALSPILKGNRLMGGKARIYTGKRFIDENGNKCNGFLNIEFQDSCNLIPTKLKEFKDMFKLDMKKEILPYDMYNEDNINERYIDMDICSNYLQTDEYIEYYNNAKEWDCIINGKIDILKYSEKYCEMDCLVLKNGYNQFRIWIEEITGLDVVNYCSIASLSLDYLISKACFDGCYKLSGIPRDFIQRCVVGGRCMTKQNKKWRVKGKINDFDAVSLYPSAMKRIEGFLMGQPKIIDKDNLNMKWLNKQSGYFVKIFIKENPLIKRDFPLLSVLKNAIREFTNELKGEFIYIDKIGLEDIIKFQKLRIEDFEIISGYYYDEGHNPKIKTVIQHLFQARLDAKKLNNPIQVIYKLLMNSCYGKCLLKPIDNDTKIISSNKVDEYIDKRYNFIKEITELDNFSIVKESKTINEHFNNVYAGVEILTMSKRIMNEVICLAEDKKLNIYYQDTDSIHIDDKDIKILQQEYTKMYKRELIGKGMGQFHSDFDISGLEEKPKEIYAIESIILGKKCYYDKLEAVLENDDIVNGDHIRMKGIPSESIYYYGEENDKSISDIYNKLYDDDVLWDNDKFDLLCGGDLIKFKYNKDMSVSSVGEFKRGVNFCYEKGI